MASEAKRGCGYRKVGGLYLVSSGAGLPCDRLPFPLTVCPTCSCGIKPSRGWTWVEPGALFGGSHEGSEKVYCLGDLFEGTLEQFRDNFFSNATEEDVVEFATKHRTAITITQRCSEYFSRCPICNHPEAMGRSGLLWIGEKFYKTPAEFQIESEALGISRRISAVPRGFKLGETWVLLAHKKTLPVYESVTRPGELGEFKELVGFTPGIFRVFRPERIEKIITEEQSKNEEFMRALSERGLTPVIVDGSDPDHQGSLWDKPETESVL